MSLTPDGHFGPWFFELQQLFLYAILIAGPFILFLTRRVPTVESTQKLVALVNDRGGNIVILFFLSIFFFASAMRSFYHIIDLVQAGKFTADNAIGLMQLQFVTGVAFGGSFGALLKTMSGADSKTRSSDNGNGGDGGRSALVEVPLKVAVPPVQKVPVALEAVAPKPEERKETPIVPNEPETEAGK